jgi:hypothetical protein
MLADDFQISGRDVPDVIDVITPPAEKWPWARGRDDGVSHPPKTSHSPLAMAPPGD